MIFCIPLRVWVTSPALPFVAYILSSRFQLPLLHCCCCSWWSSHGTGISKTLLELGFTNSSEALFMVPSLNSFAWPLQSWAINCNWGYTFTNGLQRSLTMPSLSCSSWPLHAFKNSTTWVTLTYYQVQLQPEVQPWLSLEHSFFVLPEKNSQKISPQWCWSLLSHH
jgi:hypothetical protein